MAELAVITEPLTAWRDFLRTQDIGGEVGERVYAGGLPRDATFPAIVVHRVPGGGIDTPTELVALQHDCEATDAPTAARVGAALQTLLITTGRADLGGGLVFYGADESTVQSYPTIDPEDPSGYRNIVTAQAVFVTIPS